MEADSKVTAQEAKAGLKRKKDSVSINANFNFRDTIVSAW